MNYPYANGIVKALENKVLDRNKLFVLSKYDKSEFVKVLLAMNYGVDGDSVEILITNEMAKVKQLIDEITPNKEDTNLFYIVNDAQNLKILYKIQKFNLDKYELLQNTGSIGSEHLKKAIIENDETNLNKSEKEWIHHLNKELSNITNPKVLSAMIDRLMYAYALEKASGVALKKYLICKIDFTNMISMIRAQNLKWEIEKYFEMFIDGGTLKREFFKEIYTLDQETMIKKLSVFYEEKISKILSQHLSLNQLEIAFDRLMLELMSQYKDDAFQIGPMQYYYLLKLSEAQNIRILYSASKVELKDLI